MHFEARMDDLLISLALPPLGGEPEQEDCWYVHVAQAVKANKPNGHKVRVELSNDDTQAGARR